LVKDVDGNIYNTVTIGSQTWMLENLKTTKYRDGSSIPNITDDTEWSNQTEGAYCWYNNDALTYKNTFGALYNFYTVVDNRELCPVGWHVPTETEWSILITYLGGNSIAGGKLKSTSIWESPNTGADNSSNFTSLPSGIRDSDYGIFRNFGFVSVFWTSTKVDNNNSFYNLQIYNDSRNDPNYNPPHLGASVRCLKD